MDASAPDRGGTITLLLEDARTGKAGAVDRLSLAIYDDLRRVAARRLGAGVSDTLSPTAIVHESFARLSMAALLSAEDRRQLFGLFSKAMHHVLVDYVRQQRARKRGGDRIRVPLGEFEAHGAISRDGLLDLRDAMEELRQHDPDAAEIVMLRFYAGQTLEESAAILGCTFDIARRNWDYARAWLHERLARDGPAPGKADEP